jgi:hypothetical protein
MKEFIFKNKWPIVLGIAGAIGGFLYWRFVGCASGSCPIKSVWYWSTLWGAAFGYLAGDFIKELIRKRRKKTEGGN